MSLKDNMYKRKATVLSEPELKCKNGCGFYGNPEWLGYCSKCHRELNQKSKSEQGLTKKVVRSYSDAHESSLVLGFSKFEEKKKQQSRKHAKTLKSIIKRGHTSKDSVTHSPSREICYLEEITQMCREFHIKDVAIQDLMKQIYKQLDIMNHCYETKPIDKQSEIMQDFYNAMMNMLETHVAFQDLSVEQIEEILDKIEEKLMHYMHRTVFTQISTEYEEKDLALQNRIRSLNWITAQRLGLDLKESSPQVRELIDRAITDVIEMNSKIAPQEKINSVVNCSKNILNIIQLCQGVTVSADEFLPAMVYIVLKANPPLLHSNIKYVTYYSTPGRLRSGEGAYYFTNLCCAMEFIEHMTGESLNLTKEEFDRYCAGEVPVDFTEQNASDCEGLRLMTKNLIILTEIEESNNKVLSDMFSLRDEMTKFEETVMKYKPSSPLKISQKPYSVPAHVDMSLIPKILRDRIHLEDSCEILVEIDSKPKDETCDKPLSENTDANSTVNSVFGGSNHKPLQSTKECTSYSKCDIFPVSISNAEVQCVVNPAAFSIKDLEYPTDILDTKAGDDADAKGICLIDKLSPEAEFLEESLNLPPPLQPVVIQNGNKGNE